MSEKPTYRNPSGHDNLIGQRLKMEMKKQGIATPELSRRADVLRSFIYDIISGKSSNPSIVKLSRVADALSINLTYLIDIDAGNSKPAKSSIERADYITIPHIIPRRYTNAGETVVSYKDDGEPIYFHKRLIRNQLDIDTSGLRMFTMSGDSMEPTICNQDMVMIDTNSQIPSPPSIFVLFDGFGLTAKRLEYVFDIENPKLPQIRVISDNPRYSIYERPMSDLTIVGRVVWFSREI